MSTQVQGALIIAAAVLIAAFGATYMLSPERDVERCVEARGPISEPTQEEWARLKGRDDEQPAGTGRYYLPGRDPLDVIQLRLYQEEEAERRLYAVWVASSERGLPFPKELRPTVQLVPQT